MSARPPPAGTGAATPDASAAQPALADRLAEVLADPTLPAHLKTLLHALGDELDATRAAVDTERMRYRALFDAVPDPVSVIARDGTVLWTRLGEVREGDPDFEEALARAIDVDDEGNR